MDTLIACWYAEYRMSEVGFSRLKSERPKHSTSVTGLEAIPAQTGPKGSEDPILATSSWDLLEREDDRKRQDEHHPVRKSVWTTSTCKWASGLISAYKCCTFGMRRPACLRLKAARTMLLLMERKTWTLMGKGERNTDGSEKRGSG